MNTYVVEIGDLFISCKGNMATLSLPKCQEPEEVYNFILLVFTAMFAFFFLSQWYVCT